MNDMFLFGGWTAGNLLLWWFVWRVRKEALEARAACAQAQTRLRATQALREGLRESEALP